MLRFLGTKANTCYNRIPMFSFPLRCEQDLPWRYSRHRDNGRRITNLRNRSWNKTISQILDYFPIRVTEKYFMGCGPCSIIIYRYDTNDQNFAWVILFIVLRCESEIIGFYWALCSVFGFCILLSISISEAILYLTHYNLLITFLYLNFDWFCY